MFVDKAKDVVGLPLDPPEQELVLCVSEKSQIQALDIASGKVIGDLQARNRTPV